MQITRKEEKGNVLEADMKPMSRSELADLHMRLLWLEKEEEELRQEQPTENDGPATLLVVERVDENLGAYILTLRHEDGQRVPRHIEQGSHVDVLNEIDMHVTVRDSGVVTQVASDHIKVTFSYEPDLFPGDMVFLVQTVNSCHARLSGAMEWLKEADLNRIDPPVASLVRVMFREGDWRGPKRSVESPADAQSQTRLINWQLDASQRKAVDLALCSQPLTVIHGPPGTGKTTTITEVILQYVQRGKRVLVCAPSNKGVDNILKSLWKQTNSGCCELSMRRVIRLGHLARIDENHRQFSYMVRLGQRPKFKGYDKASRALWQKEWRDRETKSMALLKEASVVMSTLSSVRNVAHQGTYDLLVIDECGQATEAACWMAIPLAKKILLAGDPCQLPPTVLSHEAARRGLEVSLMERQIELHGEEDMIHTLDTQHRMHELIQAWSSRYLYDGLLKAAPSVGSRRLTELPGVRRTRNTEPTLLLVDTAGCGMGESRDIGSTSYCNRGEADVVLCHVQSLLEAGLQEEDIGIITPYKQQVEHITANLRTVGLSVEVNSVDGYQGREKEAILLSLVRSNRRCLVGFVSDERRLNVAVTRARRHLVVVCDTATVGLNRAARSLFKHMRQNGEVRSAHCDKCSAKGGRGLDASARRVPFLPITNTLGQIAFTMNQLRPKSPANGSCSADPVSKLASSLGALTLKREDTGTVLSKENRAKVSDVEVSSACSSAVTWFDTRSSAGTVAETRGPFVRVSDMSSSAVSVSVSSTGQSRPATSRRRSPERRREVARLYRL